jgi:hypothetical protein
MKQRLMTMGFALGCLLLGLGLVFNPQNRPPPRSVPNTEDRGPRGLAAANAWLGDRGIETRSLRLRYDRLPQETGATLLIVLPLREHVREEELDRLSVWIERGNQLVLMAPEMDSAEIMGWQRGSEVIGALGLRLYTTAEVDNADPEADPDEADDNAPDAAESGENRRARAMQALRDQLEPGLPQPRQLLQTLAPLPTGLSFSVPLPERDEALEFQAEDMESGPGLPVARDAEGRHAGWLFPYERGRVWLFPFAAAFGHRDLGEADNARLLEAIVRAADDPRPRLIFDDMHQGLSDIYDAEAFISDPRLHATVLWLIGLWLLYLGGRARRLLLPIERAPAPSVQPLGEGMANLFARRLAPQEVASALIEHMERELRRRLRIPVDTDLWQALARQPAYDASAVAALRKAMAPARGWNESALARLARTMDALLHPHRRKPKNP